MRSRPWPDRNGGLARPRIPKRAPRGALFHCRGASAPVRRPSVIRRRAPVVRPARRPASGLHGHGNCFGSGHCRVAARQRIAPAAWPRRPGAAAVCAKRRAVVPIMPTVPHAAAGASSPASRHRERARQDCRRAARLAVAGGVVGALRPRRSVVMAAACLALGALFAAARAREPGGFRLRPGAGDRGVPLRLSEARAGRNWRRSSRAPTRRQPIERRYVYALYGQAIVAAGKSRGGAARSLTVSSTRRARRRTTRYSPPPGSCGAAAEWLAGDAAKANAFAKEARSLVADMPDRLPRVLGRHVDRRHGAEAGASSRNRSARCRTRCRSAEREDNAYRRSDRATISCRPCICMLKQPQSALEASLARLPVRRGRGQHVGHGEGAHGRVRGARDPGGTGAGARGDGRRARHRAQVEVGDEREPRAHQPRGHQAAAQGIRRGVGPVAPLARARGRIQRRQL